jgi:hypothetical protein
MMMVRVKSLADAVAATPLAEGTGALAARINKLVVDRFGKVPIIKHSFIA